MKTLIPYVNHNNTYLTIIRYLKRRAKKLDSGVIVY